MQEPVIPWEALVAAAVASGAIPKRKPQSGGSGAHAHKQQRQPQQPATHPKRAKEEGAPPPPLTPTSILRPQTTAATAKRQGTKVRMMYIQVTMWGVPSVTMF